MVRGRRTFQIDEKAATVVSILVAAVRIASVSWRHIEPQRRNVLELACGPEPALATSTCWCSAMRKNQGRAFEFIYLETTCKMTARHLCGDGLAPVCGPTRLEGAKLVLMVDQGADESLQSEYLLEPRICTPVAS